MICRSVSDGGATPPIWAGMSRRQLSAPNGASGRLRHLSRSCYGEVAGTEPTQPGEIGRATRAAGGRVSPEQSGCARSAPRGRESAVAAIRGAARTARSGPSGGYTLRSGCLSTVAVVSAGRVISGVGRDLRWPILAVSRRDRGGADGGVVVPAFCCCLLSMPPRRRQRRASTGTQVESEVEHVTVRSPAKKRRRRRKSAAPPPTATGDEEAHAMA